MKTNFRFPIVTAGILVAMAVGCTNLEDTVLDRDTTLPGQGTAANLTALLQGVYTQVNSFSDQANAYALLEHPSDEMMGPTRGTDWDDFGRWRRLHQHTWDATTVDVIGAWNQLNTGVFRATQTAAAAATASNVDVQAQARFLRAFFMYHIVDLYGKVPFREANASFEDNPSVFTRTAATAYIIEDLTYAIQNLPPTVAPGRANRDAARFLLAKVYLNRAVFTQDPNTPAGPFTFTPADMNQVIANCDAIINSGNYQLTGRGNYFDNFHWENSTRSKELIFAVANEPGSPVANVQNRYRMTLHYNQLPDGWNGFTTLADFYNSFESADVRRGATIPVLTDSTGLKGGFLVGQQTGKGGVALKDRAGAPLVFSPQLNLLYSDEKVGIRVIKYLPDPARFDAGGNDYVFFRYADVLLMKAEAIQRGGAATGGATALSLVNQIRTVRNASTLTTIDDNVLLAERGRELYWEGWRRNDQIRFGKFLDPVQERSTRSPETRVVFPIPQQAIDTNPNLTQNVGY